MNSILKLDLYKNPVKLSKIKRVYSKRNKDEPLKYNIKNGKVGIKEMIHLIEMYDAYFNKRFNDFISEYNMSDISSLSTLKVPGNMWNEAFKNNAIPEFYEILLGLKENYHVIVKDDEENIFPQIYVTFKSKMEIDKLDIKKLASDQ